MFFYNRYFQIDLARTLLFDRSEMADLLHLISKIGYNGLAVHLEGSFAFECFPGIIRQGVMTSSDAKWLLEEANKLGIKILPITNSVYHMEQFLDQERFSGYAAKNSKGQLDITRPEVKNFVLTIIDEYVRIFKTDIIHIGGDEVDTKYCTKQEYALFLSDLCNELIERQITPCIWGDVIWMNNELADYFSKDIVIYDWNYYGHRPDSLLFFKEKGFKTIFACASDQSWEGFINYQRVAGHFKASMEPEVEPGEVEAFFKDAIDLDLKNGLLTTWSTHNGCSLWAQMVPIVRSGLYMSGRLTPGTNVEEIIENELFGRITPYTKITRMLWEHIQSPVNKIEELHLIYPRNSAFDRKSFTDLICFAPELKDTLIIQFTEVLPRIEDELSKWTVHGDIERRCNNALKLVMANVYLVTTVLSASSNSYEAYRQAAACQFSDQVLCLEFLESSMLAFNTIQPALAKVIDMVEIVSSESGYPKREQREINKRIDDIQKVQEGIGNLSGQVKTTSRRNMVPLPSWKKLVENCIVNKIIIGYV